MAAMDWSRLDSGALPVSERISRDISRLIVDGKLVTGDRIPGERELATLTNSSRASVRQALSELQLRGLIERRRGAGTVVADLRRPSIDAPLLAPLDSKERLLREVMDMRDVIEPQIAARAAQRASTQDITMLRQTIEAAEALLTAPAAPGRRFAKFDLEFHMALARMTHNSMLTHLLEVMNEWIAPVRHARLQTEQRVTASIRAHRDIYTAVQAHDATKAAELMAEHIAQITKLIITS